jgi:hypothetical protein
VDALFDDFVDATGVHVERSRNKKLELDKEILADQDENTGEDKGIMG